MSIILILTKKEQLNRYFLALPLRLCLVCIVSKSRGGRAQYVNVYAVKALLMFDSFQIF